MTNTGNDFDLAIQGKGYFRVTLSDGGSAYTRAGVFQLSPTGQVVNPNTEDPVLALSVERIRIAADLTLTDNERSRLRGLLSCARAGSMHCLPRGNPRQAKV